MQSEALENPEIVHAVMDGVVRALTAGAHLTATEKQQRGQRAASLISALAPRDALELLLVSQAVLMAELTADAGHDVATAESADDKRRARATVTNLSRAFNKNIDTLLRLRGVPAKPARQDATPDEAPAAEPAAESAAAARPDNKKPAGTPPAFHKPSPQKADPAWRPPNAAAA